MSGEAEIQDHSLSQKLHELRTPLHQIIGLSEMLLEIAQEEGADDLPEGLRMVREAGLELTALLQERLREDIAAAGGDECRPLYEAIRAAASRIVGFPALLLEEPPRPALEPYRADLALIHKAGVHFLTIARTCGLHVCLDRERKWYGHSSAAPAGPPPPHLQGAQILVVDDESLNREVLSRRLEREGCRATSAASGGEALRRLETERFDAILLDLQMPEMSGIEVLQKLKEDEQYRQVPVIMLSAHTEVERVARCIELGAEDYLPKPINSVLLRARLNACLEKRKMAEDLLRAGKLQSIGVLAGGLAHGFNNTLTGVLGNLSLLRHREDLPPAALHFVNEAEKSAVRAQELTRYLLTFAEGGAPVKQVLEPGVFIREAAEALVRGTPVQPIFDLPPGLWRLAADPHQLHQLLEAIVTNAIEAMPGGGALEITAENLGAPPPAIRHLTPGPYLLLVIRDHGGGIAPEHLPRIFDPFFTTRQNARGLGLAAAYSIVQRHGGHISVASSPGEGAMVTLALPAMRPIEPELSPAPAMAPVPAAPLSAPADARSSRKLRVLVMDDEEAIRTLAEIMLEVLGYGVRTVGDGEQAIAVHAEALAAGEPFDVVVMDLTIPGGMGGAEAIRRLRERDTQIHAIVASGYSNDPVMAHPAEYGFNSVLPKPYVINDLSRILKKLAPIAR